jgi:hypothetical protein
MRVCFKPFLGGRSADFDWRLAASPQELNSPDLVRALAVRAPDFRISVISVNQR